MTKQSRQICQGEFTATRQLRGFAILVVVFILGCHAAFAGQPGETQISFSVINDVPFSATVDDICCGESDYEFPSLQVRQVRSRHGGAALWLKLENVGSGGLIQLSPILDDVTLFAKGRDGNWRTARTGDLVANENKTFASPFMALPIPEHLRTDTVFIKIIQPTAVQIRASHWSVPAFIEMQSADRTLKTFLLGGVSAIIVFNIFVSFLIRRVVFLLNALCVLSLLVFALYLSGYGALYFWGRWPEWSNAVQIVSLFFSIVFGGAFMWSFLRRDGDRLNSGWPISIAPGLALLALLLAPFVPYWLVQACLITVGPLLMLICGWIIIRRSVQGDQNARILLAPFAIVMAPGIAILIIDKIWGIQLSFLGNNGFEVTLCFEALLFSLALASRIRFAEVSTRRAHDLVLRMRNERTVKVIAAQDQERKRLANDLHDGIGQDFLVVLGNLKKMARLDWLGDGKVVVEETIAAATAALENLRRLSREMHPSAIEYLGLEKTVQSAIEQFSSANEIEVSMDLKLDHVAIPPDQQLHIFRIVQECLSNIVRHSGATFCRVTCDQGADLLSLTIEDNGIGLPAGAVNGPQTDGLGFASIGERVLAMNGTWESTASELGGVKMAFVLPVSKPGAGGEI